MSSYFDARAKDWDADPAKIERARCVAAAMRSHLPLTAGMHGLEFGCGTGLLSFALLDEFASITLADNSPGMIEVLRAKIAGSGAANMHPFLLGVDMDGLDNRRFDVIYSLMTLHHIADTAGVLRRFHGLLQPGGYLAIADLDSEDGSFHGLDATDVHRGFDRQALRELGESAGFGNIAFEGAFAVEKQIEGRSRSFPVFLMTARRNCSN